MQENKPFTPLEVINGKTLLDMDVPPIRYIVSDLLPVGLHLLAGSPKIGKSWFALWLCNQVATGEKVWQFETLRCPTRYLSLEDTLDRLHLRLSGITEEGSEESYFATKTDAGALVGQLESFIRQHPGVGLIVIDTFARVRDGAESSYLSDYEEMRKFKELADKHRLALVLVHHLRKAPDSDPVNMVSGSTGLIGAVDGIYVLEKAKRIENAAKLHITGRDTPDMQLELEFDRDENIWKFLGFASGEVESLDEKLLAALNKILERDSFTGTATDLIAAMKEIDSGIDIQPNRLTRLLRNKSLALEKRGISFATKRTGSARMLVLEKSNAPANDDDDRITPRGKEILPSPSREPVQEGEETALQSGAEHVCTRPVADDDDDKIAPRG